MMGNAGTIFLAFDCVSGRFYVDSADSAPLMRYVLEQERHRTLSKALFEAVNRVYPHSASMVRKLYVWLLSPKLCRELQRDADAHTIESQLQQLRDLMAEAFASRAFERHFYPDVTEAVGKWSDRGYGVVVFSQCSEDEQQRILKLAAPDRSVVATSLEEDGPDATVEMLLARFPEEPTRCLLVAQDYLLVRAARHQRMRPVSLDRGWVLEPYIEKGYSLNIGTLIDLDLDTDWNI
jgi:phosphoglycolate phosphatase-like HAD superfamily hydrolase